MISELKGKYRPLSNFWYASVVLDGVVYPTVEHAYQAAKTLNPEERAYILTVHSPIGAKEAGRKVTLRENWDMIRVNVMYNLVLQKFQRHPDLKELLLSTDGKEIQEGNNWGDSFWGVCPPKSGLGMNTLGRILMDIRDEMLVP